MEPSKRLRGRPKSFNDKSSQSRIQSLDRALDVLGCVAAGGGMTLTEIADELGQSTATIYRILTTFAARDALEMDQASQEWFVGSASFRTGSAFLRRTGLMERARPIMRVLMAQTGETANLGIESDGQVLFLSQVETAENIRAFFPPGSQSPMYASGIGKALLAHADDARIEKYLAKEKLLQFTDKTITNPQALQRELQNIKKKGYSFDNEEKNDGMRCVAAPVFNSYGETIAGLSISGPSARLSVEKCRAVGQVVKEQAQILSHYMGYGGYGATVRP